jgi:protein-tyrosine-phosphatase
MIEKGIDISQNKPKKLTPMMIDEAGLVVLTDASLEKAFLGRRPKKEDEEETRRMVYLPDPQRHPLEGVRLIRDDVETKVIELSKKLPAT